VVKRFFPFSTETGRQAAKTILPADEQQLSTCLVQALHTVANFSRRDRRRGWLVGIDLHLKGYYGQPTSHTVGGQKKQGTNTFFAYATAVLLHKKRRYTVALCTLQAGWKSHEIVACLLAQIEEKGLKIKGVTLDSGFDGGEVFQLLQERGFAYSVPMRRKGKGSNPRNDRFQGRHRQVSWMEWAIKATGEKVCTRVVLWKGSMKTMLFAFNGWDAPRARNIHQQAVTARRVYQRRFGIETSYRQKNQAEANTTSSHPVYRLLLQGLAYLLRQIWVVLTEQLARARRESRNTWIGSLPFAKMLDWLADDLKNVHTENRAIPLLN
jgi:type II secretory pathway component PulM